MLPGASGFLAATPNKEELFAWEANELIIELQHRLLLPVLEEESWCPLCDSIMDTKGHHVRVCSSGGERTCPHHAARNEVGSLASAAALNPTLEKPGLLPPSPEDPGATFRCPADIYLPRFFGGSQPHWIWRSLPLTGRTACCALRSKAGQQRPLMKISSAVTKTQPAIVFDKAWPLSQWLARHQGDGALLRSAH